MKILCFDTESSYYWPPTWSASLEQRREHFRKNPIRFDCGVVFDSQTNQYYEFDRRTAHDLVALLGSADELVSHSGPLVDLIVLEHACGEASVVPLRQIKHHDLREMGHWSSLDNLAREYAPDRVAAWRDDFHRRRAAASALGEHESFIPERMAKARYDVERSYAVFLKLIKRGT